MAGDDELLSELSALTERTKAIGEALAKNRSCTIVSQTLSPTYGSYARAIVKNRDRLRQRLPAFLVCDPAFDILLELFAADVTPVSSSTWT